MEKSENKTSGAFAETEKETLLALARAEELAERKAGIYSRTLTDIRLAEDMAALAIRHGERKAAFFALAGGEK